MCDCHGHNVRCNETVWSESNSHDPDGLIHNSASYGVSTGIHSFPIFYRKTKQFSHFNSIFSCKALTAFQSIEQLNKKRKEKTILLINLLYCIYMYKPTFTNIIVYSLNFNSTEGT